MDLQAKREDLYAHYRAIRGELQAAIDGLTETQMLEETLDGWSVKDHMAHLAIWDEVRLSEIVRISAGGHCAWQDVDNSLLDAFNGFTTMPRRHMPLEQVVAEFHASRQRVLDAIAVASERGLDESLYGEAGLRPGHDLAHAGWIRDWRTNKGI